jgi:hypothetical protein
MAATQEAIGRMFPVLAYLKRKKKLKQKRVGSVAQVVEAFV